MRSRLLVISNFYPPQFVGGYELGCRDVVEGLVDRGWEVTVLTSRFGVPRALREGRIHRELVVDFPVRRRSRLTERIRTLRRDLTNRAIVVRACREAAPDVVYIWNQRYLGPAAAQAAERLAHPVSYFVSDGWLVEARTPERPPFAVPHVQFASEFLRQSALAAGYSPSRTEVVHWGVDLDCYRFADRGSPTRLLYVGQLIPEKGFQTALSALRSIVEELPDASPTLTMVGGPDYYDRARSQVRELGLEDYVRFTGRLPREKLPAIYDAHDILLFPSSWMEPFSITLLEAMASGLAVVTTITGGTGEVAEAGFNCLAFAPGDAAGCAAAVVQLMRDQELAERIRANARRRVEQRFRLETMIDRIDRGLHASSPRRADGAASTA